MSGFSIIELRHDVITTLRTVVVPMRTTASRMEVISVAGALNAEFAS